MAETGGHLVRNIISVRETDLNALTNVGVFACDVTDGANQHSPVEGKVLVEVYVYRTDDDVRYVSQDIRGVEGFERFTRTFDGDTWSAWQELVASEGGGGGAATDLDFVRDATTVTVRSNTGTDAVLPAADITNAGIMTAAQFEQIGAIQSDLDAAVTKLNGIENGATGDMTGAEIVSAIDTQLGSDDWRDNEPVAAEDVSFNNTASGLEAENVQDAIEEVNGKVEALATDLNALRDGESATIESSTGSPAEILAATSSLAGVMTAADKTKLDSIEADAEENEPTDLSLTRNATTVTIASSTGTSAVIPSASTSNAGVMSASDKTKIDTVETGATADQTGAEMVSAINAELGSTDWQEGAGAGPTDTNLSMSRDANTVTVASDTGDDAIIPAADGSSAGVMSAAQAAKLAGIATGAQVNVPTHLSVQRTGTNVTILSDTGDDAVVPAATTTMAGIMTAADKTKLDGIETGATADMTGTEIVAAIDTQLSGTGWRGNGVTHLSMTRNATTVNVNSDTGNDATLTAADASNAGVMTNAMFTKLAGIETGATGDQTGAEMVSAINAELGSSAWQNGASGDSSTNASVRCATTGNVTIANALNVGDVVDGVTLEDGDLVLVKAQSTASQNGIYVAGVSPARDARYDSFAELAGLLVTIQEGSTHDDEIWLCTSTAGGTIDVDNVVFVETAVTPTNLSVTRNTIQVAVNSSTGSSGTIAAADGSNAGVMTSAMFTKLSGIEAGAQITDITIARTTTNVTVQSSDGDDGAIAAADASNAGVMTAAMFTKLNGIESGATADQTGAEIITLLNGSLGGTEWQSGGSSYTHPNHTGEVTSVGDGALTITDGAVTNSKIGTGAVTEAKIGSLAVTNAKIAVNTIENNKLAIMTANTIKGRLSIDGSPQDLTVAQVRTMLNVADGANNYSHPNHTGEVTSTGDGATVIAVNVVTNAKLADMGANTIKGRLSTSGDPQDLTPAQIRTLLNVEDGATAYTHPNHTGDVISSGDGVTTIVAGAVGTSELATDAVTTVKIAAGAVNDIRLASDSVTAVKIINNAVNNAKLADMAANTIKGRLTTSGDPDDLTPAEVRTLLNVENGATADQTGAEIVTAINGALGGTTWQEGGGAAGGSVGKPFLVKSNASQNIAHASGSPTPVKVSFQTATYNPGTVFSTSTYRWTPGVAGLVNIQYNLNAGHAHTAVARVVAEAVQLRKNGTTIYTWTFSSQNGSIAAGDFYTWGGNYADVCDSNDYYELWYAGYGWQVSAGTTYYNGRLYAGTMFTGFLIVG